MKNIVIVLVILVLGISGFIFYQNRNRQMPTAETSTKTDTLNNPGKEFSNPKKSAHYESNTPAHGSTLAGVPINVVINFNFDLAKPSEIKILSMGKDYGEEETRIDSNKLAMRRTMKSTAPDGLYTVRYNACWPDGSCHDGNFQFAIDRQQSKNFEDETQANDVTIKLSNIRFEPQNIRIKSGTKVTWINDDTVEHYINTESHPAHTYYPAQNSKALKKGERFSLVFDKNGIYPYHCSAHADSMIGTILVE